MTAFSQNKTSTALMANLTSIKLLTDDVSLAIIEGPHKGQVFRLEQEMVRIGRSELCDLSLPEDQWASKLHCEGWLDERGLRIRDLGSRNGIQIDGVEVFDAFMRRGQKLQVGESTIELRSHEQKREIEIQYRDPSGTLVGKSHNMRKIFSMMPRLASRKAATLLTGETGTGKSTIARAIHLLSEQAEGPFVVVNCGALPPHLVESALFGHEKGAFTGADKSHKGFFEQAKGGTLFLDEIGELPIQLQPKLLDVIERRVIRPVGSERERPVDFRLITATHRDLPEAIKAGRFREDLFFRISIFELEVPSLRERKADIPLLVESILRELHPDEQWLISDAAHQALQEYLWPGNIRELRNTLQRATTFVEGNVVEAKDLSFTQALRPTPRQTSEQQAFRPSFEEKSSLGELMPLFPLSEHEPPLSIKQILVDAERKLIQQAMSETDDYAPDAAKLLNISESWIYNRIKRYGLPSRRKR